MRATILTEKRARHLRRAMTPPEVALWLRLRARRPGLPAFRRQHPFGPYILDFYCARLNLAVEIDGLIHGTGDAPAHDALADADEVAGSIWTLVMSRTR